MQHPLLFFPKPTGGDRDRLPSGFPRIDTPSRRQQSQRLGRQFSQFRKSFEERPPQVVLDPSGAVPEQVLVLETISGVDGFQRAVARTELKWLGEFDGADVPPGDGFADSRNASKALSCRLYVTVANQKAIDQVLSLWRRWRRRDKSGLPRGLKKWGDVFRLLKDVRRWGPSDRLDETGVLEDWSERVVLGEEQVRCEVELWSRGTASERELARAGIKDVINRAGGRIISECFIEAICYHAVLAELPIAVVEDVLNARASGEDYATELVRAENVMFLRPSVQTARRREDADGEALDADEIEVALPRGEPIVALLDGLPIENHSLLAGRVTVDDCEEWAATYPAVNRVHGTAMASLIAHGDLADKSAPLATPLYVRPLTRPSSEADGPEEVPGDRLVVDAVHEAVRRMVDPDAGAVAPEVRVVNLSLGDRWLPFQSRVSPWARLLDWLAVKYGLLFVVSAGNDPARYFQLGVARDVASKLSADKLQVAALEAMVDDARHRTVLSPAEAINVLTVGACHSDAADIELPSSFFELATDSDLPAPYGCLGLGYRRSIKPDVLAPGGRAWFREALGSSSKARFEQVVTRSGPGLEHASPGSVGERDAASRSAGTSNAAAMCSRGLGFAYEALRPLLASVATGVVEKRHEALLLRVLAVHTADWGNAAKLLRPILTRKLASTNVAEHVSRFLGYGVIRPDRMVECTEQRATMLGFGALRAEEGHEFSVPVPAAIGPYRGPKRLTVTLAWFSPINPRQRGYRRARLWFSLSGKDPVLRSAQADRYAVKRGTVQHEVYEGESAFVVDEGQSVSVRVSCAPDAGSLDEPVPYALACSLEVEDGVSIPIYEEVRERLRVRIPAGPANQ